MIDISASADVGFNNFPVIKTKNNNKTMSQDTINHCSLKITTTAENNVPRFRPMACVNIQIGDTIIVGLYARAALLSGLMILDDFVPCTVIFLIF